MRHFLTVVLSLLAWVSTAQEYVEIGHPSQMTKLQWSENLSLLEAITAVPHRIDGAVSIVLIRQGDAFKFSDEIRPDGFLGVTLEPMDQIYLLASGADVATFEEAIPDLKPVEVSTITEIKKVEPPAPATLPETQNDANSEAPSKVADTPSEIATDEGELVRIDTKPLQTPENSEEKDDPSGGLLIWIGAGLLVILLGAVALVRRRRV